MTERHSAELGFQLIRTSQPRGLSSFTTGKTAVSTAAGDVLFGIDGDGGRHLLVPLAEGEPAVVDRESSGVHLFERTLLDLMVTRSRLGPVRRRAG